MSDDHPDRGQLQAYLDDELGQEASRALEKHLASCRRCSALVDRHRKWSSAVSEAATLVDVPEPDMEFPSPRPSRTVSGEATSERASPEVPRIGPVRRSSLLRAAAAVLLVAGGAFLATSAPLRAFAGDLLHRVSGLLGGSDGRPAAEAPHVAVDRGSPESRASAASIRPHEGRILVLIRTRGSERPAVRVGFRPASAAVVEAPDASFGTSPGRLVVEASGSDTLVVQLPEGIRNARVEVDGSALLRVRGGEVIHDVTPHTMNGDYLYRPGR